MKFKFLFCSMFVLIGAAQSTGLRVLGRVNYIGAAALQTHVRHCTEFKVPPGLKLAEISKVGLPPKLSQTEKRFECSTLAIDVSKYSADREQDVLYRLCTREEMEAEEKYHEDREVFPLAKTKLSAFDKASTMQHMSAILSSIGLVRSIFDLGNNKVIIATGTGFAVREDAILTAAHNLTLDSRIRGVDSSILAEKVDFYLQYDDGVSKRKWDIKDFKMPQEWLIGKDRSYDFALLFVDNAAFDTKLQLASLTEKMRLPIPGRVMGYPKDIVNELGMRVANEPLSLYSHSGAVKELSACRTLVGYDCFTDSGMSGGPVVVSDLPIALGVHTRGALDLNRGVHYADHMSAYLNKWFQELADQKEYSHEVVKIIKELVHTKKEEKYLISKLELLQNYSPTNLRGYVALLLDSYRQDQRKK